MSIQILILTSNPFLEAYSQSDWLGKLIFISLFALSIVSWSLIIYKYLLTNRSRQAAYAFAVQFRNKRSAPLSLEIAPTEQENPFLTLYHLLKKQTVDLLNKNRRYGNEENSYLSSHDLDYLEANLITSINDQTKYLDKYLYILSTTYTLAPFLGLLGTVWGILDAFTHLQMHVGNTNQMMLSGLSLALTTTVLGLIDAIPALIGYNYLKQRVRDFQTEMESFSNDLLSSVEIQYRKV